MALFKRGAKGGAGSASTPAAVADFWAWWSTAGRALADESIRGALDVAAFAAEISPRVSAIHPDLAWETSAGSESSHVLTVTAAGVPELRADARRWLLAASPADDVWAYSDLRLPLTGDASGHVIAFADRSYDVGLATADAYVRGISLDVTVHHPEFVGAPEDQRRAVTYLLLDTVLGEEAVEIWLGAVSASELPALDPVPLTGLRSVVRDLQAAHSAASADGAPSWSVLHGTAGDGKPVLVLAQLPARPMVAPQLDTYVGLAAPYLEETNEGLPGPLSSQALEGLTERLTEALGPDGRIIAIQTHAGVQVFHVYVDGTTDARARLEAVVLPWREGRVRVDGHHDPAWHEVAHLRG